jgi:peptide subunit release factor RF-3
VHDKEGNPVFLAESEWNVTLSKNDYPDIVFHTISDYAGVANESAVS